MTYEKIVMAEEQPNLLSLDFGRAAVKCEDEQELETEIHEPGVYVFQAMTSDFAPAGGQFVRFVRIFVTLQVPEREDDVIVLHDQLSSMYNKVALRFHVMSTAKVQVHMSTRARVVPIKVQCRVIKKEGLSPSLRWIQTGGQDDASLSDLEKRAFRMADLPSYKRERVYVACDEWPEEICSPLISLPVANYKQILERDSEEKRKAHAAGLVRPFLFLATMHPVERLRWAKALKVPILDLRRYGDEHLEAYWILDYDRKGLQARANHALRESVNPVGKNANWCQILYRVCHRAMTSSKKVPEDTRAIMKEQKKLDKHKESIDICLDSDSVEDVHLENLFVQGLCEAMQTALMASDPEEYNQLKIGMTSSKYDAVVQRLLKNGYEDEPTIRCFCWVSERGGASYFFRVIEKWAKQVREGTLRNKVRIAIPTCTIVASLGLFLLMHITPVFIFVPITLLGISTASFVWRGTPGKLLLPLIGMSCQRFRLALADLDVRDYYPTK